MAIVNGFRADAVNSVYLGGKSRYGTGSFLFFDAQSSTDPLDDSTVRGMFVDSSDRLSYWNGSSTIRLTGAGGVATTWEDIYAGDATFALTSATWTITQSAAAALLTLTKSNVGAGAVLVINNSGSGLDVQGTSSLWSVSVAGLATFATNSIIGGVLKLGSGSADGTLQSNGSFDLIIQTGNGTTSKVTLVDGANGDFDFVLDGTGKLDLSGTTTHNEALKVGAGDVTVTLGKVGITSDYSDAASLSLINDTVTTYGNASDAGVIQVSSESLTTGVLVNLSLDETPQAGGLFLRCWSQDAGASAFSIGEKGATVIAGVGATTAALTLTAGKLVMSDGNVAITSTDTTDFVVLTNNALLANNALIVTGSGTFTGTGANSFVNITASGLTTGTALTVIANTANTSVGVVDISTTGLTSGSSVRITQATANFTTGGKSIEIDHVAAVAGNGVTVTTTGAYTGTGLVLLTAGAATTGILLSLVSTTGMTSGSLLRGTTSTAGAVATNGIFSMRATGAYTSTSNAGLLDVQASAAVGDSTLVNLKMTNGSQLTNTALNIEQTTTTTGYTGDFVRIVGTSTTGDCNLIAVTTASTSAGDALQITGNGLVAGTSTLINLIHGTSVLGAGNSMLRITSTGSDTGTTTGCLVDLASSAATAGTLMLITSATLATGKALVMDLNGLTTGMGLSIAHTTSVIANGGSLMSLSSTSVDTSTTTGCVLNLIGSGSTSGTQVLATFAALTDGKGLRMVANALTSGIMLDLESSDAGFAGNYIRCYDGAAVDFSVGEDGRLVIAGAAGIAAVTVTAGDITTADGAIASAPESVTCAGAATTFAVDSNYVILTGDAGGNTIATITGGVTGQLLIIECVDALVTFADDNTHNANTIDLLGANITSADDTILVLAFNGTSWYMISSSVND